VNKELKKKEINHPRRRLLPPLSATRKTVKFLDDLKDIGFRYATLSAAVPSASTTCRRRPRSRLILEARGQVIEVEQAVPGRGITNGERYNKVVDIWAHVHRADRRRDVRELESGEQRRRVQPDLHDGRLGARGSKQQDPAVAGMRGLMASPRKIIETPITSNFREGLTVLEYFTSTHGATQGPGRHRAQDGGLRLSHASAGDVAQDVIVSEPGLRTVLSIDASVASSKVGRSSSPPDRVSPRGRGGHPRSVLGRCHRAGGDEIVDDLAAPHRGVGVERVKIRSVLPARPSAASAS